MTGDILVSTELKKAEKGDTSSPHMFPVFLKSWSWQALSQSVRNILSTGTFDKFYMVIKYLETCEVLTCTLKFMHT